MDNVDPSAKETVDTRIRENKSAILADLKIVPFISLAAKHIKIDKSTVYRWIKEDKVFAKDIVDAKKEGVKTLHEKAFSVLAKEGTAEGNWRPALELMKYLDRIDESAKEKFPPTLLSVLSDSKSVLVLSEILKLASDKLAIKGVEKNE